MRFLRPGYLVVLLLFCLKAKTQLSHSPAVITDVAFKQEYHVPHPITNTSNPGIRAITIGEDERIWIGTADGIFSKKTTDTAWQKFNATDNDGPVYALITVPGAGIWAGTWSGVFTISENQMTRIENTVGPISVLCRDNDSIYVFGPKGAWRCKNKQAIQVSLHLPQSIRAAIIDPQHILWVTSDVGLFQYSNGNQQVYHDSTHLISAYTRGVCFDDKGQLWVAGLGGVNILKNGNPVQQLTAKQGLPSIQSNCVAMAPDKSIWIGTDLGVVRYNSEGAHSLLFTKRWLLDDKINCITFDKEGTAWIGTANGVSAIHSKQMTLADKERFFYNITMQRHIRAPWISGPCKLANPYDLTQWEPEDDDNDGEFTGNYLAMESFRYAVTKDADARDKAKKAFSFLQQLREITGLDGFFARTIVPASWGDKVHDINRQYTAIELAEELVKEPRFKAVEKRWHLSKDGQWLWKGDTSSDEWCGHMMGYFFYYELVADKKEKKRVAAHVAKLVDHLIQHNFNMVDIDGTHTRWSVWSPDKLNRDLEWMPDRHQNSLELLAFLKLAYYMTGANRYQETYLRLIKEEHYLENIKKIRAQNPAWYIYFDMVLQLYMYPILIHCETDPALRSFYEAQFDDWILDRKKDESPLINFFYCFARNQKVELQPSIDFLRDTPLDLVDWYIDHSKREDIDLIRTPVFDELQVNKLPPASIRATVRWDKNPWSAFSGGLPIEREPVFWLLPYWMGRYLQMIR